MAGSEIDSVRALLSAKPRPVGWAQRRSRIEEVGAADPVAADVALTPETVGGVDCEWSLAPGSDPGRLLVYFHGGGYCSGSIVSHRGLVTEAGRAARCRTLAVQYRLAPEHPFPAAQDDAAAVWAALVGPLGYAPSSVALAGDSAGGNLSVATANALRAAGQPEPAALWLLSPWTDLTMSGATLDSKDAVDPLIHRVYLEELATAYCGTGALRGDPRVSVLASDLKGSPPMLIQVGSSETLLSDAVRLAEAAGAAEVPVTLEIYPGMIHAFPLWHRRLSAGRRAIAHAARFLQAAWAA
ncbi:MAG: alpha/beta hydrolase [Alsobacter sp.]